MQPYTSLPFSQKPNIGLYPKPDQSIPSHPISVRSWTVYIMNGIKQKVGKMGHVACMGRQECVQKCNR